MNFSLSSISRFFLFASVFFVAIVSTSTLFPFIVGKYVWFRTSVDLALITFLLALIMDPRGPELLARFKKLWSSPLVWAVSAFTAAFLLACFFGVDPWFSFWSNFERGEGGLQMLHLYAFFLLLVTLFPDIKSWLRMFSLAIVAGWLMIAYGIAAGFSWFGAVGAKFGVVGFRFSGSIGNPAYVATYLLFGMFFCLYTLFSVYRKNMWKSVGGILSSVSLIVFAVFFYLAATRGAFIGLVVGLVAFAIYMALNNRRYRTRALGIGAGLLVLVAILIALRNNPIIQKIPGSRIIDISFSAQTFSDRTIMWKTAWWGFEARPIFGWGPENFLKVFDTHFNPQYFVPANGFGAWFDRAHSWIFDYLAETGAVGLLTFISIWVAFFYEFSRLRKKEEFYWSETRTLQGFTLALPIAYLVQGLVLFDVLVIYYSLFLFLAFITSMSIYNQHYKHEGV